MYFRSELLRALGVVALLMPAAIADSKAQSPVTLASISADPQAPAVGAQGRVLPVFFLPQSAELTPAAQRVLANLTARLKKRPDLQLTVSGYAEADEAGQAELAARRAQAVRAYFAAQGIASKRLTQATGAKAGIPLVRVLAITPLERRAEITYR